MSVRFDSGNNKFVDNGQILNKRDAIKRLSTEEIKSLGFKGLFAKTRLRSAIKNGKSIEGENGCKMSMGDKVAELLNRPSSSASATGMQASKSVVRGMSSETVVSGRVSGEQPELNADELNKCTDTYSEALHDYEKEFQDISEEFASLKDMAACMREKYEEISGKINNHQKTIEETGKVISDAWGNTVSKQVGIMDSLGINDSDIQSSYDAVGPKMNQMQREGAALKAEIEALKADIKTFTAAQETTTQINEDIAKYRSKLTEKYNACNDAIENARNSSEEENASDSGPINFFDMKSASVKSMYETAMSQLNELAEKTKSMSESLSSGTVDAEQLSKLREAAKEEGKRQRKCLENLDNSLRMLTNNDLGQTIGQKGGVSKIPG